MQIQKRDSLTQDKKIEININLQTSNKNSNFIYISFNLFHYIG
ncbi:unnamed protein product [Paramecium octaurelia]|uniref:Uncharacterized protein n=1 Tax=Paramecium octaurelia TaxID=43137 RepID=A0A8S1V737_PAROT|nr:unnamed protein product [Paramecium octaurelia]